jgi:hypothetical protein
LRILSEKNLALIGKPFRIVEEERSGFRQGLDLLELLYGHEL